MRRRRRVAGALRPVSAASLMGKREWVTLGDAIWRERLSVGVLAAATVLIGVVPNVVSDLSAGGVAPIAAAVTQAGATQAGVAQQGTQR